MKQHTISMKKTIIIYILFATIHLNDITQDEIGEVEYIKIGANNNWKFSIEYFRYDDKSKTYQSHLRIDEFECDMRRNQKNSVIHFQVNNDLRQVVLQGEQKQTNKDNSIIKLPLVNVLKKNILMKAFCQQTQIDLYIYNFDHEFEGVLDLIQFSRVKNKFKPNIFTGYKFDLMKFDMATQDIKIYQNLSNNIVCKPDDQIIFTENFKFEFYVIEGDGKITSRIKRNVQPDDNLNLLPSVINSMENREPYCFWYRNNNNIKLIMRNMKHKKRQNEHEDYTLFQYILDINGDTAQGFVYQLDDTNKENEVSQCNIQNVKYLKQAKNFEFKYIFIKGKSLLSEFTSQDRENFDSPIEDTMFIAHRYILDFQAAEYDCKLHFINNAKDNIVNGYFYFKQKNEAIDEYIQEEENLKNQQKKETYDNLLGDFDGNVDEIIDQQIQQDDQLEKVQMQVEEDQSESEFFEEFSEEEQERESESFVQDSETEKALEARRLFRLERAQKMKDLFNKIQVNQQKQQITTIKEDPKPQPTLNFNFKNLNKVSNQESSSETIQRIRNQNNVISSRDAQKFRVRQFQNFQKQRQDDVQINQNKYQRPKRLVLNSRDFEENKPIQLLNLNKVQQESNQTPINQLNQPHDPRFKRFQVIPKDQLQERFNLKSKLLLPHKPDNVIQLQRQNRFDKENDSTQQRDREPSKDNRRSSSISPEPFVIKKPIRIKLGQEQVYQFRRQIFEREDLRQRFNEISVQDKKERKQRIDNFRKRLYIQRQQSLSKLNTTQQSDQEEDNNPIQKPILKIKLKRKISPERQLFIQNLKAKLEHQNQWFIEIQQQRLFIKRTGHNIVQEQVPSFLCQPLIQEHAQQIENLNEAAQQNVHFQWINEKSNFVRKVKWEQVSQSKQGTWQTDNLNFNQSEFILRFKLNQNKQYCMYKIHKDYLEIMFLRRFSNVTYHSVEFKNNILKYEIYDNIKRNLIIQCEQNLPEAQKMPLITAYFTDRFGISQELQQKMVTLTKFSRKFLIHDKENMIFPHLKSFCVIDKGGYQFKQRIYLRSFEAPETNNFQFVQVHFKDYKINIFDLHYKDKVDHQVIEYDFSEQLKNTDLETLYYIVNSFVHKNVTSKTNLVNNGYKIRLPYLLLDQNEQKRELTLRFNQIQNNNFLYIYLTPSGRDMHIIRSGLFLTSNYQLNYFIIDDNNNTTLQRALDRNQEIDNFIRVRQTNNQLFILKNGLTVQDKLNNKEEYIDLHNDTMRLLEGYYLEVNFLDFLPERYSIDIVEARVKLESFSIHIEQIIKAKILI